MLIGIDLYGQMLCKMRYAEQLSAATKATNVDAVHVCWGLQQAAQQPAGALHPQVIVHSAGAGAASCWLSRADGKPSGS